MLTRRQLLAGVTSAFAFRDGTLERLAKLPLDQASGDNEQFWLRLRSQFDIDPDLTVFNHAGLSPSPVVVREAAAAQTRRANADPSYVIWRKQDAELDPIRKRLAALVGCEEEELALTMNATYGLQTGIMGLPLKQGERILATSHDYPRALTAMDQRRRRDGVENTIVSLVSPPETREKVASGILEKITPDTKLVLLSQMTFLTGQLLPVREVREGIPAKGVPVFVDAAHGIGLLPDTFSEMGADLYTACLHKWLMGPVGTGVFVVRRPWIRRVWPLHPADDDLDGSMRKFEQVGTRPAAPFLAIREALDFHEMLGRERKAERLETLRKRLAQRVLNVKGARNYGSLDPAVCRAVLTVGFGDLRAYDLAGWLLTNHRIHVTTVLRAGIDAIRISPNVFTTFEEVDRLGAILDKVGKDGFATG